MGIEVVAGTVVEGRYTLQQELGSGGFGEVWLARDERLLRPVALKIMRAALSSNEALRKRFEREGPLLAQLDHGNVVRVYDQGLWEGRAFVVLEYVEGGTLADWLDGHRKLRRRTSVTEARDLFLQICAGVAAASVAVVALARDPKAIQSCEADRSVCCASRIFRPLPSPRMS